MPLTPGGMAGNGAWSLGQKADWNLSGGAGGDVVWGVQSMAHVK